MTTNPLSSGRRSRAEFTPSSSIASRANGQTKSAHQINHDFPAPESDEIPSYPVVPPWKRRLDLCLVLVTAPLVAPLMGVVALIIRFVSPGPIFFRQTRVGYAGRPFRLLKFRTMRTDADSNTHHRHLQQLMQSETPMTKLDADDPRVIPCGRLLRATGLDELPQLLNVLRGEMSVIGPRPCTPFENDHYTSQQRRRFGSLPGLTGLWQVSGKNRTTFQEMIRLDVRYVETSTIWLDLTILVKTPLVILAQVIDTIAGRRTNVVTNSDGVRGTEVRPVES